MPDPVIDAIHGFDPSMRHPPEKPAAIGILLEVASSPPMDAHMNDDGTQALEVDVSELLGTLMEEGAISMR